MNSFNAYFSDLTYHLEDTIVYVFWLLSDDAVDETWG